MENITEKVKGIVAQAPSWTFEYDMSLLELMKMISQNLEQHASNTSESLQQLCTNVERTSIGLENTANSLTALQFGQQFVESRCHDDDETLASPIPVVVKDPEPITNSEEMLKSFLRNNLDMLQNCHEKYAIDMNDSDDEDDMFANTCIFQAKNPYNERLLPHIYNSNLWKENWHVGLAEDTVNDYSGDEASTAYSESSSASIAEAADNESYDRLTGELSAWTSSASLPQANQQPIPIVMKNAITANVQGQNLSAYAAGSDTRKNTEKSKHHNEVDHDRLPQREYDLFAPLRTTPPPMPTPSSTRTPSNSSINKSASISSATSSSTKHMNSVVPGVCPDVCIESQNEPELPKEPLTTSMHSNNQIKRKPVNLFDDDDFNSFMSEIVDKAQAKETTKTTKDNTKTAVPTTASNQPIPMPRKQTNVVDLFTDKEQIMEQQALNAKSELQSSRALSRTTINLFDDLEDGNILNTPVADNDIKIKPDIPKFTAQSLFDDDDEDEDDFLNVFSSQRKHTAAKSTTQLTKTNLFDDDDDDDNDILKINKNQKPLEKIAHTIDTSQDIIENPNDKQCSLVKDSNVAKNETTKSLFFASDDDDDLFETTTKNFGTSNQIIAERGTAITSSYSKTIDVDSKLQETRKKKSTTPTKTKLLLAEESDEPNLLLGGKSALTQRSLLQQHGNNLFDDENDDNNVMSAKSLVIIENVSNGTNLSVSLEDSSKETVNDDKTFDEDIREANKLPPIQRNPVQSVGSNDSKVDIQKPTLKTAPRLSLFDVNSDGEDDLFKDLKKTVNIPVNLNSSSDPSDASKTKDGYMQSNPRHSSPGISSKMFSNISLFDDEDVGNGSDDIFHGSSNLQNKADEKEKVEEYRVSSNTVTNISTFIGSENDMENVKKANENLKAILKLQKKLTKITADAEVIQESSKKTKETQKNVSNEQAADDLTKINNEILITTIPNDIPTITKNITQDDTQTESEEVAEQTATTTIKDLHNYSSIFLDEPPDDNDFLECLNNQSIQQSTARVFDDFYEPALPTIPSSAPSMTQSQVPRQTEAETTTTSTTDDYKGIRLFSDLPPDDEYDPVNETESASTIKSTTTVDAKRLHSIFYDDFSETIAAVKQNTKPPAIPAQHSFFDDQPPSDEDFSITKSSNNAVSFISIATSEESTHQTTIAERNNSKDIPDHAVPKHEPEIHQNIAALQSKIQSKVSPTEAGLGNQTEISKLKLPNLNINVQALLPGTNLNPSQRKSMENTTASKPNATVVTTPSTSPMNTTSDSAVVVSDNILVNVCKNRVRAPANRRPSSRKARQDNYRKSLVLAQNEESQMQNYPMPASPKTLTTFPIIQSTQSDITQTTQTLDRISSKQEEQKQDLRNQGAIPKQNFQASQNIPKKTSAFLFTDSSDDDQFSNLFERKPKIDKTAPKAPLTRPPDVQASLPKATLQKSAAKQIKANTTKSLFDSDSGDTDDEDLFKSNKNKKTLKSDAMANIVPKLQKTLFSSHDDKEPESISQKPLRTLVQPAKASLFSDVDSNDDDDDLFGRKTTIKSKASVKNVTPILKSGRGDSKIQQTNKSHLIKEETKKPIAVEVNLNNPLADLLK